MTDAYGEKALESACSKIRNADQGERNDVLNVEAYSLGGLIATDRLNESDVTSALLRAAMDAGLTRDEARATIRSGLKKGKQHPRWVDERKEEKWLPRGTPTPPPVYRFEPKEPTIPGEKWVDQAHILLAWAHEKLLTNETQLNYLKRRGIRWETVLKFVLGWNPGKKGKDIYCESEDWGMPEREKKIWLPKGLVIPCFAFGRVVRVRVRRENKEPRYVITPGSSSQCLVIENSTARAAIVVESELDAFLLEQEVGDLCTVVALGSAAMRPDQKTHEVLKSHEVIFVNLDYDLAGAKEFVWWQNQYSQAKRLIVPEGKDPGEAQRTINVRDWIYVAMYNVRLLSGRRAGAKNG